ncbi:citrate synthase 2 [Rhodococcus sp. NPDC127530]|uniref:citrate synthase 2 n=1 Tax=unclassified Rhodococcus (in: high G+C Gram-positive bacteria) TaxID=192944 RepID=UPI00363BFA40
MDVMARERTEGLDGVIAFASEIAEPDKSGGALRYRGVDVRELVAEGVRFDDVWSLLVDGRFGDRIDLTEAPTLPYTAGDVRIDIQSGVAALASRWGFAPLLDIDDATARGQLAKVSASTLSFAAQSARGPEKSPVPAPVVQSFGTLSEQFLAQWRGEVNPDHAEAIDTYWVTAAEHGMNASTFTARVIASTGADVAAAVSGAVGAMSGPLHGGAPARVLPMLDAVEKAGRADRFVKDLLDRGERLMGFGHRVYRAEDPRAAVLRATAQRLGAPRYEVAVALEDAALAELRARRPDRVLHTNVEFWAAVVLDYAAVPPQMMPALFTCGRTAGWCAHILEQKRLGRLVRPSAVYVGADPRSVRQVENWAAAANRSASGQHG